MEILLLGMRLRDKRISKTRYVQPQLEPPSHRISLKPQDKFQSTISLRSYFNSGWDGDFTTFQKKERDHKHREKGEGIDDGAKEFEARKQQIFHVSWNVFSTREIVGIHFKSFGCLADLLNWGLQSTLEISPPKCVGVGRSQSERRCETVKYLCCFISNLFLLLLLLQEEKRNRKER